MSKCSTCNDERLGNDKEEAFCADCNDYCIPRLIVGNVKCGYLPIEQKSDIEILIERIIALESKVLSLELMLKVGEFNPYDLQFDSSILLGNEK